MTAPDLILHGGASGSSDHLREIAFDYAFILPQLGRAG
jgi:protease II